jgi:hypothetical protein
MRLNRRKFIFLGLGTVPVLFISLYGYKFRKNKKFNDDLEKLFSNFSNFTQIKLKKYSNTDITSFENKIAKMLSNYGIDKTLNIINQSIKKEYRLGSLELVDGWIITETELKILILRNKNV